MEEGHPIGEQGFTQNALVKAVGEALTEQGRMAAEHRITTAGGRFQVRRDENDRASALGQLAFFAEFPEVTSLFERWAKGGPLSDTSSNAPSVQDVLVLVLGTWFLSILDGQHRYAHITATLDCAGALHRRENYSGRSENQPGNNASSGNFSAVADRVTEENRMIRSGRYVGRCGRRGWCRCGLAGSGLRYDAAAISRICGSWACAFLSAHGPLRATRQCRSTSSAPACPCRQCRPDARYPC